MTRDQAERLIERLADKTCRICNIKKESSQFRKRNDRSSRRNECRDCMKVYLKQYHKANRDTQLKRRKEAYRRNRPSSVSPNEMHGMHDTAIYNCWGHMKSRCSNPNDKHFKNYGGRGIKVCDRWLDFGAFWEDIKHEYQEGLSIDRIDVNGHYCPENVRWVTMAEQAKNKTNNVYLEFRGEQKIISEWAKETGIKYVTLHRRIKDGWSVERALTTPPDQTKQRYKK